MSGFYNNWVKVENPTMSNNIVQMRSGASQVPFYFGGSFIPSEIDSSFHTIDRNENHIKSRTRNEVRGKGVQKTIIEYGNRIHMPAVLGSFK